MLAAMPRPERTPLQKALAGPAGEAYVLFRLYQRGMLASLAPPGSPTVDVLVLAPDETVIASLQVKTRHHGRDRGWMLRKKHESIVQDRYFYALVDLEPDSPVVYIVPSAVVADVIAKNHRAWLNAPGRGGRPHQDNEMRRVAPDYGDLEVPGYPAGWLDQYRERWVLLERVIEDDTAQA